MAAGTHRRTIFGLWVGWLIIIISLMTFVGLRFQPQRPDTVLPWTADVTTLDAVASRTYLSDPFLNVLVNGDSEHYLSIATVGYDDPLNYTAEVANGSELSINYGFMPLYPWVNADDWRAIYRPRHDSDCGAYASRGVDFSA